MDSLSKLFNDIFKNKWEKIEPCGTLHIRGHQAAYSSHIPTNCPLSKQRTIWSVVPTTSNDDPKVYIVDSIKDKNEY